MALLTTTLQNIGEMYQPYWVIFDFAFFFAIFYYAMYNEKTKKLHMDKKMAIVISLALAFGIVITESATGKNLAFIASYAIVLLAMIFGYHLWTWLRALASHISKTKDEKKLMTAIIATILTLMLLGQLFGSETLSDAFSRWLMDMFDFTGEWIIIFGSVLMLVGIVWALSQLFSKTLPGEAAEGTGRAAEAAGNNAATAANATRAEAEKLDHEVQKITAQLDAVEKTYENVLTAIPNIQKAIKEIYEKLSIIENDAKTGTGNADQYFESIKNISNYITTELVPRITTIFDVLITKAPSTFSLSTDDINSTIKKQQRNIKSIADDMADFFKEIRKYGDDNLTREAEAIWQTADQKVVELNQLVAKEEEAKSEIDKAIDKLPAQSLIGDIKSQLREKEKEVTSAIDKITKLFKKKSGIISRIQSAKAMLAETVLVKLEEILTTGKDLYYHIASKDSFTEISTKSDEIKQKAAEVVLKLQELIKEAEKLKRIGGQEALEEKKAKEYIKYVQTLNVVYDPLCKISKELTVIKRDMVGIQKINAAPATPITPIEVTAIGAMMPKVDVAIDLIKSIKNNVQQIIDLPNMDSFRLKTIRNNNKTIIKRFSVVFQQVQTQFNATAQILDTIINDLNESRLTRRNTTFGKPYNLDAHIAAINTLINDYLQVYGALSSMKL